MSSGILSVSQAARAVGEITGVRKPHQSVFGNFDTVCLYKVTKHTSPHRNGFSWIVG
jgi:hypothetical protein